MATTRTVWESKTTKVSNKFYSWDAMDEECLREGAAIKQCFHTTAVKGTPRRKTKLSGGPKNRKRRVGLVETAS